MTVKMAKAKHSVAEAVRFGKDVSGSAVRNAGEQKLTLVAVRSKVGPLQMKAFPIWTRQLICSSVQ